MNRVLSLITPTGRLTLGTALGALPRHGRGASDRRLLLRRLRPARDDDRRTIPAVLRDTIAEVTHALPRGRARPGAGGAVPAVAPCRPTAGWRTCSSARRTPASWAG